MSSNKKSKMTKAQMKTKQQLEEEEKRLQEEEEAKLQAEREEQQRLERERKEKEIERLELKNQERREDELNELRFLLEENHSAVTSWKNYAAKKAEWDRYMRCDGCPDPASQQDINTYISLWRDDRQINFPSLLDQFNLALQLIEELEDHLNEAADLQKTQNQQEAILNLQNLIHSKHLLIAEDILKNASANIDTETGNMQTVIRHDKFTLCIWANLKKNPRFKNLDFEEVGLSLEVPKQLAVSDIAVRILHTRYDHLSLLARMDGIKSDLQGVDLRQYTPLGGVFHYDVFHLPPQPYWVKGWEVRQMMNRGLQVSPYLTEKPSLEGDERVTCLPVGVSVTLPDSVVFMEAPQVARWDAADKHWKVDGITDVFYEEAEAKISFKMESFQAFTLMQKTYVNFPFKSWQLRPLGQQDSAIFTIKGALKDLSITIKGCQCMLQAEPEKALSHLVGKWISFSALQSAMITTGINIFVNEHTDAYISPCGKDALMEHVVYEQMALFASACAFSWSKWNTRCGAERLVLKVCEHSDSTPVPKDSWSLYLLGAQRSQMLKNLEDSEDFSPDQCPGSELHSTFIHLLQDNMSPEGIAKTRQSHYLFVDTVQSLLCATRPLMYA